MFMIYLTFSYTDSESNNVYKEKTIFKNKVKLFEFAKYCVSLPGISFSVRPKKAHSIDQLVNVIRHALIEEKAGLGWGADLVIEVVSKEDYNEYEGSITCFIDYSEIKC